jgi:hypothetical protein
MKHILTIILIISINFIGISQTNTPPKDSSGKDFAYYQKVQFTKTLTWNEFVAINKHFCDSLYNNTYKIVSIDSVNKIIRFRLASTLKSRGMIKSTHKPEYDKCKLNYDFIVRYQKDFATIKITRIIHYYTHNIGIKDMGALYPSAKMKQEEIEIPLIQTDVKLYTKKVLAESNQVMSKALNQYAQFNW